MASTGSRPTDPVLEDGLDSDIVIPVMGPTKSGKSYFLNQLLGSPAFKVGKGLASCTAVVTARAVVRAPPEYAQLNRMLSGRRIVLVDTPGFDDTYMGDDEILIRISEWLAKSYRKGMLVGGVLYLHDITAAASEGSMVKSLNVFSKICGEYSMDQVAIVTTKWGRLSDGKVGDDTVNELCTGPWNRLLTAGARVVHLQPTNGSTPLSPRHRRPWDIVHQLVIAADTRDVECRILRIQDEIVNDRLHLLDTDAGRELQMSLDKLLRKAKDLRRQAKDDAKAGKGVESLESRLVEIQRIIAELEKPGLMARAKQWLRGWGRALSG